MLAFLSLFITAEGYVDPECQDVADQGVPEGYSEEGQQYFLLNYFCLFFFNYF